MKGLIVPAILLMLAVACLSVMPGDAPKISTVSEGWILPKNDYEAMRRHALDAIALADQIMLHPACRSQFESLPDWPTGPVPTEIVYPPPGANFGTTRAWTDMRSGEVFVLVPTVRNSSVARLAATLIHERAHVASKSDYAAVRNLDPKKDMAVITKVKTENELRVQKVTRRCMTAAGFF